MIPIFHRLIRASILILIMVILLANSCRGAIVQKMITSPGPEPLSLTIGFSGGTTVTILAMSCTLYSDQTVLCHLGRISGSAQFTQVISLDEERRP